MSKAHTTALRGSLANLTRQLRLPDASEHVTPRIPLATYAQKRFWLLQKAQGADLTSYNECLVWQVQGAIPTDDLQDTASYIGKRFAELETALLPHQDEVILKRIRNCPPMQFIEQSGNDLDALLKSLSDRPFDLEAPPLYRAGVLRQSENRSYFAIVIAHACIDSACGRLLTNAIEEFLNGRLTQPEGNNVLHYAHWERQQDFSASLAYWQKTIVDCQPNLLDKLPQEWRAQKSTNMRYHKRLKRAFTDEITAFCAQCLVSPFQFYLAAFVLCLHKYTHSDDITIGTVTSLRKNPAFFNVFGFLANTVPLRLKNLDQMNCKQLLETSKAVAIAANRHAQVPFDIIHNQALNGKQIETFFAFNDAPAITAECPEGNLQLIDPNETAQQSAKMPLALSVYRHSSGDLALAIESSAGALADEFVEQMPGHMIKALQWLLNAEKTASLQQAAVWTANDAHVRQMGHGPTVARLPYEDLKEAFCAKVEQFPEHIAVDDGQRRLTYRQLDELAENLAASFSASGPVGVYCDRTCDYVVALVTAVKKGLPYVSFDAAVGWQRNLTLCQRHGVAVIIHDASLADEIKEQSLELVDISTAPQRSKSVAKTSSHNVANDTAYIVFTSGSTGQPKAVEVSHANVLNLVAATRAHYSINQQDRVLSSAGFAFDVVALEIWPTLLSGATVCLVDEWTRRSPMDLWDWMRRMSVTICSTTTPIAQQFFTQKYQPWPQLRCIWLGGDRMTVFPPADASYRVFNHYGPAEATVLTTIGEVKADDQKTYQLPPIGYPIGNTKCAILDSLHQPVGMGIAGELYIGGQGVAKGYRSDAAKTKAAFIEIAGEIWYRTGDFARLLPDGQIDFLGRKDNQVKIRGVRIEIGEIEACLRDSNLVNQCVVTTTDVSGQKQLVAYVVPTDSLSDPVEQIKQHMQTKLLPAMVPDFFVTLDSIPINQNGKVDLKQLPPPQKRARRNSDDDALKSIWQDILCIDVFNDQDNFFDLGGNSLKLAQLQQTLLEQQNVKISYVDLFRHPTLTTLRSFLESSDQPPTKNKRTNNRQSRLRRLAKRRGVRK